MNEVVQVVTSVSEGWGFVFVLDKYFSLFLWDSTNVRMEFLARFFPFEATQTLLIIAILLEKLLFTTWFFDVPKVYDNTF